MLFHFIGGYEIYRPRPHIVNTIRPAMGKFLTEQYGPGLYTDEKAIQGILHRLVDFYGNYFDSLIPKLASRNFLEFILWQYDQCGRVNRLKRSGNLSGHALHTWNNVERNYGRTLKYIAERITMLAPNIVSEEKPSIDAVDQAYVCAEGLVTNCILSDQTRLHPRTTQLSIEEENGLIYIDHTLTDVRMSGFAERIFQDTGIRDTFFDGPNYELNSEEHSKLLDPVLRSSIGLTYKEALNILSRIRDGCTSHPDDPWGTKFVLIDGVVQKVAAMFNKPEDSIEKLLSGFWLTKETLLSRARPNEDLWKPSNHYRAYRRALFVMPHELGPHMAFSDNMFLEALTIMRGEVSYNAFPKEWRTPEVDNALGKLSTYRGHWFEKQVKMNMDSLGIFGFAGRTTLGRHATSIKLDGEFDFIGWSSADKALVLIETKMLQQATEPGLWKNQCDLFTITSPGKESYVDKLERKAIWLGKNAPAVVAALVAEGIAIHCEPEKVLSGFITYAPVAASYFVQNFPCVALSEFVSNYSQTKTWPYETGSIIL